jgi:hypoxanthine phosphoribosyltransferase
MQIQNIVKTQQEIDERLNALAEQINHDYKGLSLDIVCLLNGASMFCSDLIRKLTIPVKIHQIGFSSYPNGSKSGEVRITLDITQPLENCHVLMLEGVIVSGRTPHYVYEYLKLRKPSSIEICAFGKKPDVLAVDLPIKYAAFEFGSEVIVGYGIGDLEKSLPYIINRS